MENSDLWPAFDLSCFTVIFNHNICTAGDTVILKVVKNPTKKVLDKNHIHMYFGEKSRFASPVTILQLTSNKASLKMETCSGNNVLDRLILFF